MTQPADAEIRAIVARWRDWDGDGLQHVLLRKQPDGIVANGVVLGTVEHAPFAVEFQIACDRYWRVKRVAATALGDQRRIMLTSDGAGRWYDESGRLQSRLAGAIDVDLTITPFTNTLPIRRLGLVAGQSADIRPVYIRMPEYDVVTDPQRYTCIEPGRRYRYEALDSDFVREIDVDEHGLVVTYQGLFKRVP